MNIFAGLPTMAGAAALAAFGYSSWALADDDSWEFVVAPLYLWAKNIKAVAIAGPSELPLDLDFQEDILENLDAAFAIHVEARKGDWTLFAEYNYAKLAPTTEAGAGPITIEVDVDFRDTMLELGGTWSFLQTEQTRWELLGGVRYFDQDITLNLSGPSLPGPVSPLPSEISVGDDWWQPFAGLRFFSQLSENWAFGIRGDYGYKDSDNAAFHMFTSLDYRFRGWGSAFIGYRYLFTDFDNGSIGTERYAFDGDQQGPVLGLKFHF